MNTTPPIAAAPGEHPSHPDPYEALRQGDRELFEALAPTARIAAAKEELLPAGGADRRTLLLVSGWACRARRLPDGRRAILDIYLPGDLIGLDALFSATRPDSVIALTNVSYKALDHDTLRQRMRSPAIALRVAWHLAEERRRLDRLATMALRMSAAENMALFLLTMQRRVRRVLGDTAAGARRSFGLPLTQQQVSDHLGLTVVHVNRVLRSLREQGVVVVQGGTVIVHDLERLKRIAAGGGEGAGEVPPGKGQARAAHR